jgi:dTDP-4-amino-4,6-dideoxygalactose transaminase
LVLKAWGLGAGDEVILPTLTALPTAVAVLQAGATPVFADVEPETLLISPASVQRMLGPRTRALIPVHLYGNTCSIDILRKTVGPDVRILEDVAQALGAKDGGRAAGTVGEAGAYSFYPTKNLGALGDGGLVVTNSPAGAKKLRLLRQYGWKERFKSEIVGRNSRLDEIQAAILRVKLRRLPAHNDRRRQLAALYEQGLSSTHLRLPSVRPSAQHVFHQYVVRSSRRDALKAYLKKKGIETAIHYPWPIHLQPAYRHRRHGSLAGTEAAASEILSLPLFPELSSAHVLSIVRAVKAFDRT